MIIKIGGIKLFFSNESSLLKSLKNSPDCLNQDQEDISLNPNGSTSITKKLTPKDQWFCLVTWKQKIENQKKLENGVIQIDHFGKRVDATEKSKYENDLYNSEFLNQLLKSEIFKSESANMEVLLERPDVITDDMAFFEKLRFERGMSPRGLLVQRKLVALLFQNLLSFVVSQSRVEVHVKANYAFDRGVLEPLRLGVKKEANLISSHEVDFNKFGATKDSALDRSSLTQNIRVDSNMWGTLAVDAKEKSENEDNEFDFELDLGPKKLYYYEVSGICLVSDIWKALSKCREDNTNLLVSME